MKQVAVSVVIPVYNNGPYIAAAVKSVLEQTYPPAEIIVVDDGSTDDTANAVAPFKKTIKYVYQANRGEPGARNRGIQESSCDFIAFLDGDDLWRPNKLELQMELFERRPECALAYSDMSTFDEKGIIDESVNKRLGISMLSGRIFPDLFMRSLFGSGSVVFRKKCVDKVGYFDEEFLIGSDYEMWLRISRHFVIGGVDQPLLMYRFHQAMATRGLGLKLRNGMPWEAAVITKILELYPEAHDELGSLAIRRRLARPYAGLATTSFRRSDHRNARTLISKAISYWPSNLGYWTLWGGTFLHPAQVAATRKIYRKLSTSRASDNRETSRAAS
jgi:glycosyltransferase involved in cell wall biosynthesis